MTPDFVERAVPLPPPPRRSLAERLGLGRAPVRASVQTSSGLLSVRDRDGFRELVARDDQGELVWTRSSLADGRSGWPYVDLFHLAAALAERRERALFIGCGGGVAMRQFAAAYPGLEQDVVEREPAVLELARAWFALGDIPHLHAHHDDGARFVRRAPNARYDVVIVDAFDSRGAAPELMELAFFRDAARVLRPGGALGCNLIGTLAERDPARDVVRAARDVFRDVRIVPVLSLDEAYSAETRRNLVLVAAKPF